MIRIEIEGQTASDVRAEMRALLGQDAEATAPAETPVADDPKPVRRTTKPAKTEEKADPKPASEKPSEEAATSVPAQSSAAGDLPEGVDPTDKGSVKTFVSNGADIIGLDQLGQVFGEFGATKFGEVPQDKWGALVIRIDDLIKAKEA